MQLIHRQRRPKSQRRAGTILVVVTVLVAALATISLTMVLRTHVEHTESESFEELLETRYVAEAGLSAAYVEIINGADGLIGTEGTPFEFGASKVWVETTPLADGSILVHTTGEVAGRIVKTEIILSPAGSSGGPGVFGELGVRLYETAFVDSYDSSLGSYDSQRVNVATGLNWAGDGANVVSNGNISMGDSFALWGNASPGVNGSVSITGSATCSGSTVPMEEPEALPVYELPIGARTGPLYYNTDVRIEAGNYFLDSLQLDAGATAVIAGPSRVVVDSLVLGTGCRIMVDSTDGPVQLYLTNKLSIAAGTAMAVASGDTTALEVYILTTKNTALAVPSSIVGRLFAPLCQLTLRNGFQVFGSVAAEQLEVGQDAQIHCDVNLQDGGGEQTYVLSSWREVSDSSAKP